MSKRLSELNELFFLLIIRTEATVGRYRLSAMLEMPEGIIRGIMRSFEREGYINSRPKAGTFLTKAGEARIDAIFKNANIKNMKIYDFDVFGVGPINTVLQVQSGADKVRSGVDQRDAAVKAGANGTVILTYREGTLRIPGTSEDMCTLSPEDSERLLREFSLSEGDVVLVSFAEEWWQALRGALAAAFTFREITRNVGSTI